MVKNEAFNAMPSGKAKSKPRKMAARKPAHFLRGGRGEGEGGEMDLLLNIYLHMGLSFLAGV